MYAPSTRDAPVGMRYPPALSQVSSPALCEAERIRMSYSPTV